MLIPRKYALTVVFILIIIVIYQSMHLVDIYVARYIPTKTDNTMNEDLVETAPILNDLDLHAKVPELKMKSKWSPFNESRDLRNDDWERAYHKFLKRVHVECGSTIRVGHEGDGGWDVCVAGLYEPTDSDCLVYSFGINTDWSFDDEIGDMYGCQIRAFDPTLDNYTRPTKRGKYINFFPIGLSDVDGDRQLLSYTKKLFPVRKFSTLLKQLHDEKKVIDYVKMDIEYSEWEALPSMATEGILPNIKQLGIELHSPRDEIDDKTFKHYVSVLNDIESAGFRKWSINRNPHCMYKTREGRAETFCYEVEYINFNFLV